MEICWSFIGETWFTLSEQEGRTRGGEKTESAWAMFSELVVGKKYFPCLCKVATYNLMLLKEITHGTSQWCFNSNLAGQAHVANC